MLDREETTMRIGIDPGHGTLRPVNGSWVKDIGTAAGWVESGSVGTTCARRGRVRWSDC